MINITDHVFYPLDRKFEYRLWKRIRHSEIDFINELSSLSQKYVLTSIIRDDKMIWKDSNDSIHLILHFNIKALEIDKVLKVYKYTKQYSNIQNFILVDQTQTFKQAYDIFRLNRLSFMQHCNHFRIRNVKRKRDNNEPIQSNLYSFFCHLKPHQKYRWGRIFLDQNTIIESLEKECKKNNLDQIVEDDYIFWINKQDKIECMLVLVYDPSNIDTFIGLYSKIIEKNIKLTFSIVNQFPDGKYEYDIFRISEKSYLEHCNRVRPRELDIYNMSKLNIASQID